MKLLTKTILKNLPALYANEELASDQIKVPVKFFAPTGGASWYATEYSLENQQFFGFVNLGDDEMAELGYFSLEELENIKLPLGLKIERDFSWDPKTTLEQVMSFKVR